MQIAVCDTCSLIKLRKGDVLYILGKMFDRIYIPRGVEEECSDDKTRQAVKEPFFQVKNVHNILPIGMGKGEREVISLAIELNLEKIITDDIKAIRKAEKLNLSPLTSELILIIAKELHLIDSVKTVLDKMRLAGEGIEDDVYSETLRLANE